MLTDAACRNAHCPEGQKKDRLYDTLGMYLETLPSGTKSFWLKYRFGGKEKRFTCGAYPKVSLATARATRDAARLKLQNGIDPAQDKKDAKAARRVAIENSFQAVATAWHAKWKADKTDRHAGYVWRRLEADVFPAFGAKPISEVTALQIVAMAKRIESRDAVDIAKRAVQSVGQIMRFGVAHGLLLRSPSADFKPSDALQTRRKKNYARLDEKQFGLLLRKTEGYNGAPSTRLALNLMALTFPRTTELIAARWEEFDLEKAEWRIPASRMKMRVEHIVPLSRQALQVIAVLQSIRGPGPMVFPGERDHERSMSSNTLLKALERLGYKHQMTTHGYRGTASTILHELGYRHDVIELQLAHTRRDTVAAAYDHSTLLRERRELMQAWADHLDGLRAGAKILPFKAA